MDEPGELTPEQEAGLRRLLRESAGPERMPDQVAARLDDVLARLVAERAAGAGIDADADAGTGGDVVPMRHRRWPRLLVAAAAVCVIGYGGASLVQLGGLGVSNDSAGGDASMPESTTGGATDGTEGGAGGADQEGSDDASEGPGRGTQGRTDTEGGPRFPTAAPPRSGDAALYALVSRDQLAEFARSLRPTSAAKDERCAGPVGVGPLADTAYRVRTAPGQEVLVTVRPLTGRSARVDVFSCALPLLPVASQLVLGAR